MQLIMFTKHLEGLDIPGIIAALQSVGVQGADLCVRPGYPVNPDNIANALPTAARYFADAGLSIPLVTSPTSFNRPDIDYADRYYAACAEAGVKHVKIGYWHWQPDTHYWDQVSRIRDEYLPGFAALSQTYGVQTVLHTHSGYSLGLNASAAMHLVRDFDPAQVGIFADTGHLSICGEPIDMALDIVRDYLSAVSFKDLQRVRAVRDGELVWGSKVRRLGEGFVDWSAAVAALDRIGFGGPVTFHSEYSGEPTASVIDLARCDVRFIQRLQAANQR